MARRATPRARQIAGLSLGLGALMLGCQAEEARIVAGDGAPVQLLPAAAPSPPPAPASAALVTACVDYVGVMAMAGDGFAVAILDQAGGADGLPAWCEATAVTDPTSLRRMGKELSAIELLAAGSPTTTSTVPLVAPTTEPPSMAPPSVAPPSTAPPAPVPPTLPSTTAPTTLPPVVILGEGCDPNYAGACVPIAVDVDCAGRGGNGPVYVVGPVRVVGEDIYGLDGDRDRTGCE